MKNRWLGTVLILALLLTLLPGRKAAAGSAGIAPGGNGLMGYPSVGTPDPSENDETSRNNKETFVIGESSSLSGAFNPFFFSSESDGRVVDLTNALFITLDASGVPVAGREYNTVAQSYEIYYTDDLITFSKKSSYEEGDSIVYDFVLKHGAKFSDGSDITAEDVLFSFYVMLDPGYFGNSALLLLPIWGLDAYQSQIADDEFRNGLNEKIQKILATNRTGYIQNSDYTRAEYNRYWDCIDEAHLPFIQGIVDYCCSHFADQNEWDLDLSAEGDRIAFAMYNWGYGYFHDDGSFNTYLDEYFNLTESFPTLEIFWNNMLSLYGTEGDGTVNYYMMDMTESGEVSLTSLAERLFKESYADEGSVQKIAGLMAGTKQIDGLEYEMIRVILTEKDPAAMLYFTVPIAPKAYYTAGYQYAPGALVNAGVRWGLQDDSFMQHLRQFDLSPMGAGPYRFVKYENGAVTLVRNEYHYTMGDESVTNAKIKNVRVKGNFYSDINALNNGSVHFAAVAGTQDTLAELAAAENLKSILVDYPGYGYIWLNPQKSDQEGFAFDNLHARIALASALKTSESLNYYGEGMAEPLYRSMYKSNWAYPEGAEPIYPYDESLTTTIRELKLAGYKYDEGSGRFTDVPALDFYLPSRPDDHPSGAVYLATQALLAQIGITVNIINDPTMMTAAVESGLPVFSMAWMQTSAEPDLQRYAYSSDYGFEAYGLPWLHQNGADVTLGTLQVTMLDGSVVTMNQKQALEYLDALITESGAYLTPAERKPFFEKALEILAQLAIEIPTYQRKEMYVYNKMALAASSLPSKITTNHDPLSEIWKLSLVSAQAGWRHNDYGWWYLREDGTYPVNQWEKIGGKWYHFDSKGYMQTGWLKLNDKWYYLSPSGAMQTGWQKVGGKWYYMDASGVMQTGWQKINNKWYYLNPGGSMVTGWKQISGKWYYFTDSGVMVTGWRQIDDIWYYFKSSGAMAAKEWCDGYYLNANGSWTYKYRASWKQNAKGVWYGDTSGWYAKSCTITIDGQSYTFDANGYVQVK